MTSEAEWHNLLDACNGSLADAWLVVREIARSAVVVNWRLPVPPPDRPYERLAIYGDELGDVSLMHWRPGVETAPFDIVSGRTFMCLVRGELYQRRWRWNNGRLTQIGERRVKSPDMLLAEPGQVFSFIAPESAVSLSIQAPGVSGKRLYDPSSSETLLVSSDVGPWLPEDPEVIQARQSWASA